ncbi:hypothetical protein ACFVJI_21970 [Streptomyces sp. NPDC127584]|uniref:hypothetical protein n=1 Tax=Streptomyces sp. NPDC127584 TaxID=3345403 RepID=UPI0036388912
MSQPQPTITDHQVKHLEMIQAIVTRLGNGSFLIKGWTMTLAGVFLGFAANRSSWRTAGLASLSILGFWLLDAYYLRQERIFRALYEAARQPGTSVELFSMDVRPYISAIRWLTVVKSQTLVNFYGVLSLVNLAVAAWWFFRS